MSHFIFTHDEEQSMFRNGTARVNLGSGPIPEPGYVNIDRERGFGAEIVHDLNHIPWPIPSESCQSVRAWHILEHLTNPLEAAKEICRILKPGGYFSLQVPHEKSQHAKMDWSHTNICWNRNRIVWLTQPTNYVQGIRFKLVRYEENKLPFTLYGFLNRWSRWDNVTAIYQKM